MRWTAEHRARGSTRGSIESGAGNWPNSSSTGSRSHSGERLRTCSPAATPGSWPSSSGSSGRPSAGTRVERSNGFGSRSRHPLRGREKIARRGNTSRGWLHAPRMSTTNLEPLLREAERRAVLTVLRGHPEWTLGLVFSHLEHGGARAPLLRDLTLG